MFDRLRMTNPAVVATALALAFTIAGPRAASAYLMIDWLSCRAEIVPDWDEHVLRKTGREICDLVEMGPGIIFRPEPREPRVDKVCDVKTAKAKKAVDDAKARVTGECAKELDGPSGSAAAVIKAVSEHEQYLACQGVGPKPTDVAAAEPGGGTTGYFNFFNRFFGSLSNEPDLKPMKNDDLRRQLTVLNLVAFATGRIGQGESRITLNNALRSKCFSANEQTGQTGEAVDANGIGTYSDATAASNDANDGVLGDDGSGAPPTEDVFVADPNGDTVPPDEGGGGCCDGGDDMPMYVY
jgi:hypothetical protein